MTARVFVDTNVLVYSRDAGEPDKQPLAEAWIHHLWREERGRLSFQVLQEFYVTVTQKLVPGMPKAAARADIRSLGDWRPVAIDAAVLETAWQLQDRYRLSWWDAQIVAAAQRSGCRCLLSEDFQAGQRFGDVEVVSPFDSPPPD